MADLIQMRSPRSMRNFLKKLRRRRTNSKGTAIIIVEKEQEKFDSAIQISEHPADDIPAPTALREDLPSSQSALVVARKGEYELRDCEPLPEMHDDEEVVIRGHCVGLNPIDWKSVDYNFCLPQFPWITGREMSGTVVRVGKGVKNVQPGDKVWTSTYYRDKRAGCFQEFIAVPKHTVLPIPDTLDFEKASCIGVPALTAAMTLWKWLGVPSPGSQRNDVHSVDADWLLVWGGSTVTGQFATQLAALSGLRVITVTSSKTKALSQNLGASHVVIRDAIANEDIVREIRAVTKDRVKFAIDLVGPSTASSVLQAVSQELDVQFAPLAMMSATQPVPANVNVHTVEMKRFVLDSASATYAKELNQLFADDRLQFPDIHVLDGGLRDIVPGLEMLKRGDLGGKKLVVRVA